MLCSNLHCQKTFKLKVCSYKILLHQQNWAHHEVIVVALFYRGTSLKRNCPPPQDHHMTLGICYCRVLGGGGFL